MARLTNLGQPSVVEPCMDRTFDSELAESAVAAETDSWRIVRKVQRGDKEAFGILYARYHRRIYGFVLKRTGQVSLAEDLTSETFLRAFRSIESLHFRGRKIDAWLMTIARNVIIDHKKSGCVRNEVPSDTFPARGGTVAGPEEAVLSGVVAIELHATLAELTDPQRKCLFLRFYKDLSISETAKLMARNSTSVRALQYRAVRRLGEIIGGHGAPTQWRSEEYEQMTSATAQGVR